MKYSKQLKILLGHEDNCPNDLITILVPEIGSAKMRPVDLNRYVNIYYCCWGKTDPGSLKGNEKKILNAIGVNEAVLLKMKYPNAKTFIDEFDREMHWINQMSIRKERFKYISKIIYDKVDEAIASIGNLEIYIENNFDKITKKFPVDLQQIKLEKLNKSQILKLVATGEVTPKNAEKFIDKLDRDKQERNSDKLCPFSGRGNNPDSGTRICSRTDDPKRLGDCGTCRVAAEWEEVYG